MLQYCCKLSNNTILIGHFFSVWLELLLHLATAAWLRSSNLVLPLYFYVPYSNLCSLGQTKVSANTVGMAISNRLELPVDCFLIE